MSVHRVNYSKYAPSVQAKQIIYLKNIIEFVIFNKNVQHLK